MSYIGTNKVGKMYLGSTAIGKAYLGSGLVYDGSGGGVVPLLPTGFTQLDYLENATNGILTDIATIGSTWIADVQMAATPSATQMIVCSDENAGHWLGARTTGNYGIGGTGYEFSQSVTTRSAITVSFASKSITATCNGTTLTRTGNVEHSTYVSLFDDMNITTNYPFKGKIYSVRCISGGDFYGVPAQRDSDGIKGIYDIANDVFYPMSGLGQQNLPSGYTQLDYINNATAMASTGITSVGSVWELDVQSTASQSGTEMIICSNDYAGHWFGVNSTKQYTLGGGVNFSQSSRVRRLFQVDFVSNTSISATCDGTTLSRTGTNQNNSQVVLCNYANAYQYKGKIFYVKCTSGGSFEGIPAQRTSDNKKGLYDIANDVFYPLT